MLGYVVSAVYVVSVLTGVSSQGPVTISPPFMQCSDLDSCSCRFDDGTVLNLTALSRTDGMPYFANISDGSGDFYSWNPCRPFTLKSNTSECENVAVCMFRRGMPNDLYYSLGTEDSAKFTTDENGTLKLTYTADKGTYKRVAEIHLQCMENSKFDFFVAQGETDLDNTTKVFKMVLGSKRACGFGPHINPAQPITIDDDSLGGGVIFLIVLLSLVGSYVIFGMLYQAIVKGETGTRVCPNHEIWCNLPGIKNVCGSSSVGPSQGAKYDSI